MLGLNVEDRVMFAQHIVPLFQEVLRRHCFYRRFLSLRNFLEGAFINTPIAFANFCGGSLQEVSGSFRNADWSRDTRHHCRHKKTLLFIIIFLTLKSYRKFFRGFGLKPSERR